MVFTDDNPTGNLYNLVTAGTAWKNKFSVKLHLHDADLGAQHANIFWVSQGSVAVLLRRAGMILVRLFSWRPCEWKEFENPLIFDDVMTKLCGVLFWLTV